MESYRPFALIAIIASFVFVVGFLNPKRERDQNSFDCEICGERVYYDDGSVIELEDYEWYVCPSCDAAFDFFYERGLITEERK